jgi:hypothetical protein
VSALAFAELCESCAQREGTYLLALGDTAFLLCGSCRDAYGEERHSAGWVEDRIAAGGSA